MRGMLVMINRMIVEEDEHNEDITKMKNQGSNQRRKKMKKETG